MLDEKKGWVGAIVLGLLIIFSICAGYFYYKNPSWSVNLQSKNVNLNSQNSVTNGDPTVITNENLQSYIENQEFIKNLPDNALFELKLYNFNSGERQWEESYSIKKGEVVKISAGDEVNLTPDAIIIIHSKYLNELGNGFCGTIQKAKANGDLGIDLKISQTQLLWKYNGLLGQRSCLGL